MMLKFHWYPTRSKTWSTLVSEVERVLEGNVSSIVALAYQICVFIFKQSGYTWCVCMCLCRQKWSIRCLVCTQLQNSAVFIIKSMRLKDFLVMLHHVTYIGRIPTTVSCITNLLFLHFFPLFSQPLEFSSPSVSLMFSSQGFSLGCLPLSLAPSSSMTLSTSPIICIIYSGLSK